LKIKFCEPRPEFNHPILNLSKTILKLPLTDLQKNMTEEG